MPAERAYMSSSWRTRDEHVAQHTQSATGLDQASGHRIYVENMPYTAQRRDIEPFLKLEGFELYVNLDLWLGTFRSSLCHLLTLVQRKNRHLDRHIYIAKPLVLLRRHVDLARGGKSNANLAGKNYFVADHSKSCHAF